MNIHPTAIVHPDAELDPTVEVRAYSIVGPHVKIGAGTVVGPHCSIEGRTVIGERNQFFSGAQIGILCQDLKHRRELIGRTQIGNDNVFREHVTISASSMTSYEDDHRATTIGDNCLFMANSHVGHDSILGSRIIMANCCSLAGHVEVEDDASLAGLSAVHQYCSVGVMSMVGGLTAVTKDVPPYMIVNGNPARCCGPNSVKLRRVGMDMATRLRIKAMYKTMFRSSLNTTQALHEIEAMVEDCEERTHFLDFVRKSLRGITK